MIFIEWVESQDLVEQLSVDICLIFENIEPEALERIKANDQMAIRDFVKAYDQLVFNVIRKSGLQSGHDIDDIKQETMISIINAIKNNKIIDPSQINGYIWTAAKNTLIDFFRKKKRNKTVSLEPETWSRVDAADDDRTAQFRTSAPVKLDISPEEEGKESNLELIKKAMASLPSAISDVIQQYYFKGDSISDIANSMNLPVGTVKRRMSVGRDKIRELLGINL